MVNLWHCLGWCHQKWSLSKEESNTFWFLHVVWTFRYLLNVALTLRLLLKHLISSKLYCSKNQVRGWLWNLLIHPKNTKHLSRTPNLLTGSSIPMWCSECLVMLHQPPWHISQAKWRRSRGVGSENIQHGRCSFHWKGKECHSYIYCSLLQSISNYVFHYCQCSMLCILHSLKQKKQVGLWQSHGEKGRQITSLFSGASCWCLRGYCSLGGISDCLFDVGQKFG